MQRVEGQIQGAVAQGIGYALLQLRTPVTFIMVNNSRYAILEAVAAFGGLEGVPSLELPGIDFLSLAASYGCPATRVTAPEELREVIHTAAAGAEPVLIEVVVDSTVPPLLLAAAGRLRLTVDSALYTLHMSDQPWRGMPFVSRSREPVAPGLLCWATTLRSWIRSCR